MSDSGDLTAAENGDNININTCKKGWRKTQTSMMIIVSIETAYL